MQNSKENILKIYILNICSTPFHFCPWQ